MESNTSSPTVADGVDALDRWAADGRALLELVGTAIDVPDDTLLALIEAASRARDALDAVTATCVGEVHARGTTDIVAGLSTGRWLRDRCAVGERTSRRLVRVATTVRRDLPVTAATLAAVTGWFGFDHATVMADAVNERIVTQFAALETELVAMAEHMVFDQWRTHVRIVAALLDQDGGYDPDADVANNRLSLRPGPDGTIIAGSLVGDVAVTVDQTLDAVLGELIDRHRADAELTGCDVPGIATLRALALAEVCRRALGVRCDDTKPGRIEATLVVHADDLDTVYDTHDVTHRAAALGPLLCDAELVTVVLDSLGVPLDLGRTVRLFDRAQRRALARRDGGCVFPGCDAPPERCHAHHVDHWTAGGRTDLARGVLLCTHHHGVIHRNGWALDLTPDARAVVTTPAGSRMWGQRHHERHRGPLPASCARASRQPSTSDERMAAARRHLDRRSHRRGAERHQVDRR